MRVPAIYFHSLVGSRGDPDGAATSGINRRINRAKLDRARLEAELADATSLRAAVFNGYRDLLATRRRHAAFAPAARQRVLELDPRVFAVVRETADGTDRVLCLHNVSSGPVTVTAPGAGRQRLGAHAHLWLALR